MPKPVVLAILDGWGIAAAKDSNAATSSDTPTLDTLLRDMPHAQLKCSGKDVGLPQGQQGNSEVGHLNLGGGRVVYQDLLRIDEDIQSGAFARKEVWQNLFQTLKETDKALHFMGLLSDGGVHSHQDHLFELLQMAKDAGLTKVYIHAFLDGRDVPPKSGIDYLANLEKQLKTVGIGQVASVSGRYYAMDRDNRWDRVEKAWRTLMLAEGDFYPSSQALIEASYAQDITDEFVVPAVVAVDGDQRHQIEEGDGLIFYNYRADRAREITKAIQDPDFDGFERSYKPAIHFIALTEYEAGMDAYLTIAYPPLSVPNNLGEWLSKHDKKQVRIAETEKYAHVTFFFNGGVEEPNPGEDRILIPSPKVATYDLQPEMSAPEVADQVVARILGQKDDFILVNFANPDMVGHTGKLEAAQKAMEAVDNAIKRIVEALDQVQGTMLLTADHGNCECMIDEKGGPHTAHTTNPVPIILYGRQGLKLKEGRLADVAPTVLDLMNMDIPEEMTGQSLIEEATI